MQLSQDDIMEACGEPYRMFVGCVQHARAEGRNEVRWPQGGGGRRPVTTPAPCRRNHASDPSRSSKNAPLLCTWRVWARSLGQGRLLTARRSTQTLQTIERHCGTDRESYESCLSQHPRDAKEACADSFRQYWACCNEASPVPLEQ